MKPSAAPVAKTVGDLIVHYLKLENVDFVFGIPGGGIMHLLVNLKENREEIQFIICRQETGAAYIADGYYRATGKIGVVAVTTGPGATNAVTGMMNAQADGSAVMLISGEIDERYYGMGYLQEGIDGALNINEIYANAVGYSTMITSASNAETLVKHAFRNALSIPRQAVHLSLPVNVSIEPVPNPVMSATTKAYRASVHGAPPAEVKAAMSALLKCSRPLLFLGNGCRQALYDTNTYSNLLNFVETYAIPVMTTADGKGIFPENHELSLRVYGIADCMWPYQYLTSKDPAYDGIMVIGSELGELSTNSWLPILKPAGKNDPFIHVDINQKTIGQSFEVTHGVVGEAGAFINDLANLIDEFKLNETLVAARRKAMAAIKKSTPFIDPVSYNSNTSPLEPAAMMRVLQECMPSGTKIFIDAGNCVGWSVHYLAIDPPSSIFTSLSMGPMGFGVASVIGGRLGCPDSTCISITGDGAFMMQGSEISTAAQYKVGAIWIVLYDNNLGMVSQGMEQFFPDKKDPGVWQSMYALGDPDLELYSKSLGADAYSATDTATFKTALNTAIIKADKENKPQVIIAKINKKQVPPYYNPVYLPVKPK